MAKIAENGENGKHGQNGEFLMGFQIPAWVPRPERTKGAKDEVPRPERPSSRSQGSEGP